MNRFVFGLAALCAGVLLSAGAEARSTRHAHHDYHHGYHHAQHRWHHHGRYEGWACHGRYGGGPEVVKIAGFFMGGRQVPPRQGNPRDTRSFQGCFETVAACEAWQGRLSMRYPIGPGLNHCIPVRLR